MNDEKLKRKHVKWRILNNVMMYKNNWNYVHVVNDDLKVSPVSMMYLTSILKYND
jgi:hypothetical protein